MLGLRAADRAFYPGVWDVFGGHLKPGESPSQALRRELDEEPGIVPVDGAYLTCWSLPASAAGEALRLHLYAVRTWRGQPQNRQPHEHAQIAWFEPAQLAALPLAAPDYRRLLARLW